MKQRILALLRGRSTYVVLVALNVAIGILIFLQASKTYFPDAKGYQMLGEGLLQGRFSSWYFLQEYIPETLRTPGYPVFLSLCMRITQSEMFVRVLQLLFYFAAIFLCTKTIHRLRPDLLYRNLFLLLLLPNVQIVYYSGLLSAESLTIFFVAAVLYLVVTGHRLVHALLLGAACYAAFILRPVFLFFPFLLAVYLLFRKEQSRQFVLGFILTYGILLIPFGWWNKKNHGVFKVTPLEGGAGVAHLGYWQQKLPDGYAVKFYWDNNTMYDFTRPHFYSADGEQQNARAFEAEGNTITQETASFLSSADSLVLDSMTQNNPGIFVLFNSQYTLEREKLLWQATRENIMEDPWYYIKSRVYHFMRSYVTGINYKEFGKAGTAGKIKQVYPFAVTLIFIFLGMLWSTFRILSGRSRFRHGIVLLSVAWYYGLLHVPFVIQARYTVPAHLAVLMLLSLTLIHIPSENGKSLSGHGVVGPDR